MDRSHCPSPFACPGLLRVRSSFRLAGYPIGTRIPTEQVFGPLKRYSVVVNVLNQIRRASFWGRYWSLFAALIPPILVILFRHVESIRTLVSIISVVLLTHAWRMRLRSSQSVWCSLLWTSILLLPMLGVVWLGLNVVRSDTYEFAADSQRHLGDYRQRLYWYVVETQDWIYWVARLDLVLSLLLGVAVAFERKFLKAA